MGYGPADENRFGWCWRDEHGSGRRMTPYFESEEIAENFHEYFTDNIDDVEFVELPPAIQMFMSMSGGNRADLRRAKLYSINKLAKQFAEEEKIQIVDRPVAETMREFYGVNQEHLVGYTDPTPYPWEDNDEDDKEEEIEDDV